MFPRLGVLAAILLAQIAAPPAAQAAPGVVYVFGGESHLTYRLAHPLHVTTGESDRLQGAVQVLDPAEGSLQLPLRLTTPVRSFRSGNRSRDRNMALVMQAERHPFVELLVQQIAWRARRPTGAGLDLLGEGTASVRIRGVTRPAVLGIRGTLRPQTLSVTASFSVSLEAHGVERPSLMLRPVDDLVELTIEATATPATPAP